MKRRALMSAFILATVVASGCVQGADEDSSEAFLTHGPLLGPVQQQSAGIWLRTSTEADVDVEWADNANFANFHATGAKRTSSNSDLTMKAWPTGLEAGKTYWYRIKVNSRLQAGVGQFRTAPESPEAAFTMAVLTDFSAYPAPVLTGVDRLKPDIVVFEGDLDHRNPGLGRPSQQALNAMRKMHRKLLGNETEFSRDFNALMGAREGLQYPFLHVWDDHDFGKNNADITLSRRSEALQAFNEYFIKASNEGSDPNRGIWQVQSYGAADIFLLDLRSERDPNRAPNGWNGVSPADCSGQHGSAAHTKTILGPQQKKWFKDNLLASRKKWKIIISTVPFNPSCKPYDAWGAFPDERNEIVNFIKGNNVEGVVIVSGDIHSGGAIDDGTNSVFPEISTPHANMDFVDTWTGGSKQCGNWSHGMVSGSPKRAGGPGFVFLVVSQAQLVMSVRNSSGKVRNDLELTLSSPV